MYAPAVDEFAALVDNGARCRDILAQERHAEACLARGIERYKSWAYRDGRLQNKAYPEPILVCSAKPGESVGSVVDRTTKKLRALGQQWRDAFRHQHGHGRELDTQEITAIMPTLFAFVVKYSIVSIMSYDPNMIDAPTRTIETLDHQIEGHDVWHAFAISITCVYGRNYLLRLESNGLFQDLQTSLEDTDL